MIDPSGAAVGSATLTLTTPQGSTVRSALSDGNGHFMLRDLPNGAYELDIVAGGFAPTRQPVLVAQRAAETVETRTIQLQIASANTTVTVTATRGGVEDIDEALPFVTVTAREQLVQRPLATIANALEGAPGVSVQQTTAGAASPILHGLTGHQTLLLVDGIRFNTSIFRSGPNQYIALVDPNATERIEVAPGPAGAAYGSDSMGGTINMLSVEPRFADKHREVHTELNLLAASADLSGQTSGRVAFGGERFALSAGASAARHNDLRAGGGNDSHNVFRRYFGLNTPQLQSVFGTRLQDTGFLQYSADTRGAWRVSPNQTVTLRYLRTDLQNDRSYRDTWGGANRIQSAFDPQSLNFAFARYEKVHAGVFDTLSGTVSFNQQNDGAITRGVLITDTQTTDRSRVNAKGYAFQATAHVGPRQAVMAGGEAFDERIYSTRFNLDPSSQKSLQDRALYPNNSRYTTVGLFLQDTADLLPGKLRGIAGARFTGVRYATTARDNIDAAGKSLGVTDSSRTFSDVTFNAGAQWQAWRHLAADGSVSRGFRAPNVNDLGGVGAKTLGYDVTTEQALAVNALLGADSSDGAAATGREIAPLGPETLMNYQAGFRVTTSRLYVRTQVFDSELRNPISGRTLLFPSGQTPATIGGIAVTPIPPTPAQAAQGVVAVLTSLSPRAVHTAVNDGGTRYFGTDNHLRFRINTRWTTEATYSFLGGLDLKPVRPTRRLPPQEGSVSLRYTPSGRRPWLHAALRAAGPQPRLNQGDVDDDRIGASRRRSDIQTVFRSYHLAPFIAYGPDGRPGTTDDLFLPTNETLRQIQDRVLPLNTVVNGVLIAADSVRVPLYVRNPGWVTVNLTGGYPITDQLNVTFGVSNLLDKNYRTIGSGIDAPGVNFYCGLRFLFR